MNAPVAQRIEQQPSKLLVVGSNPARGAINTSILFIIRFDKTYYSWMIWRYYGT